MTWCEKLQQARKEFNDIQKVMGVWGCRSNEAQSLILYWFNDYAQDFLDTLEKEELGREHDL